MSFLFNDVLEGKYVINNQMSGLESYLSPSSEGYFLKITREIHMENYNIKIQEHVSHHDIHVVVGI